MQDSGFAMLMLVFYEKATTIFEEVAQWWRQHLDTPTPIAKQKASRGMGGNIRHRSRKAVPWGGGRSHAWLWSGIG